MTSNEGKRYLKISEYLWQLVLIVAGVCCVIISFFIEDVSKIFATLNGIGISLVLSGLIGIFMNVLFYRKESKYKVCEEWQIKDIYESRAVANNKIDAYQECAKKHVDIIAFGLTSWRQAKERLIDSMLAKGVKIRIITIDPDCDILVYRDYAEGKQPNSTSFSISKLQEFFDQTENRKKVEIRYHQQLPLDFYFRVDNYIFVGPYLYGKESQQTITYEFEKGGKGFDYYLNYFEDLWNGKTIPKLEFVDNKRI